MAQDTEPDQYDREISRMDAELRNYRERRDSQQPDSDDYREWQKRATSTSARLRRFEANVDRVRELDGQIAAGSSRMHGLSMRHRERRSTVNRAGIWASVGAVAVFIICLTFAVTWHWWLVFVLLVAGAVAAGAQSTNLDLNPPEELQAQEAEVAALWAERKDLLAED